MMDLVYKGRGFVPESGMYWKNYAIALLVFNALEALFVYAIQRLQVWLPLNPQAFTNITPDSSFNTAISFIKNTDWQGYSSESAMSYLTQMLALTGQNFSAYKEVKLTEAETYQQSKNGSDGFVGCCIPIA